MSQRMSYFTVKYAIKIMAIVTKTYHDNGLLKETCKKLISL